MKNIAITTITIIIMIIVTITMIISCPQENIPK